MTKVPVPLDGPIRYLTSCHVSLHSRASHAEARGSENADSQTALADPTQQTGSMRQADSMRQDEARRQDEAMQQEEAMSQEDAMRQEELQQDTPPSTVDADRVKSEPADDDAARDKGPPDGRRSPRHRSRDCGGGGGGSASGGERRSSGSERFDRRAQPLRRPLPSPLPLSRPTVPRALSLALS